jgi:translocation and assembly module TamB
MRRALKISAWVAGISALVVVLLVTLLMVAGNTARGRSMIEKLTLRLTGGVVSLVGLAGSFPEQLTLDRLELRDLRGVWFSADRVSLSWSPLALFARRIQVDALHAQSVDMQRLPESTPGAAHSGDTVSIPRIDAGNVVVDVAKLGPELAGAPASLQLRGSAHLRSLEDMLIDATAHRIDGDGNYSLQLHFDPKRMDASLEVHEPAGGPLQNMLQLPGLGAAAASLSLHGPRDAERLDLTIEAGTLRGRAQGIFNLHDLTADLDVDFESKAEALRPDLAWERASVHGRWHGSVKTPNADAHVELVQLRVPGGTQLAAASADLKAESGMAKVHALISGLRIPGAQPKLLEDSPVTVDASMRLNDAARPLELSATHRLFALQASAQTVAGKGGGRDASAQLRLPNTQEFAALIGVKLRGGALIKARLHDDATATRLTLDASATPQVGSEIWSAAVGDSASLQLAASLTPRAITIESLKFTGRALALTASGDVSRPPVESKGAPQLRVGWDLSVADLKTLAPTLAGTAKVSGKLYGPSTALAAEAQLTAVLSVRNSPSGALTANIKMHGLPTALSGSLAAQGMLDGAPIDVDVDVERAQAGAIRAVIHRAAWKSVHADGDINVGKNFAQSHGQLSLAVGQLADLQDLLGIKLAGNLTAAVSVHPGQGHTAAEVRVDAHEITAGPFIGDAQLTAEGVADAFAFKLALQAPNVNGAKATLSAGGSLDLEARRIELASAVANYRGQDVSLKAPAHIDLANGVAVDDLKLGAQEALFELKGEISPALDASASLSKVQPALVNAFVPGFLATGTFEAQAQLQGSLSAPTGQIRFTATDTRMGDDSAFGLPPLDARVTAQLMGDTAQIDAHMVAGTSKLNVTGRAPMAADGAVDLKIDGAVDVGIVNPLLEARGQHASGDLTVNATVGGSVAEPQIDGTVNLAKGTVRDYVRGISLTDITAAIVGRAGTLQIESFTASAAPGKVTMTGKVGVLQKGMPVDLHIKADNAQPLVSKLVTSNFNAELHVSGTAREHLDIGGTVHLNRTLIGIPNGLPPNVAVLDVRRRGKAAPAPPDKPLIIALDVSVLAPQEILVQGRGLDAEMGGELHISGTTDTPLVSGGFDLQRGNFSIAGNKLNFTAGRVSFNGAGLKNKIDPTLDFTAQAAVTDVTATLRITGLADAPAFEFTSSPVLPQDEIMARLLFGTNAAQLSGLQLAQIGAALATLSGVGGDSGLNPLVKLQKSLGLDRLTVGSATTYTPTGPENTGASIEAGRYVSKRVYVEAKQTTTGASQLEADVDLTKHLKLQTRLGNGTSSVLGVTPENDPGSSVGLVYQFEY